MSDDLIKREDAINVIWEYDVNPSADGMIFEAQSHIDRDIRLIPSADRPQGEWIAVDSYSAFGGSEEQWNAHGNPIAYHYCSNCKSQTRVDEFGEEMLTDFCPNCGARMKGEDDE